MMKIISCCTALLLIYTVGFSQTEKGRFLLSGKTDLGYLFSHSQIKQDSVTMRSFTEKSLHANLGFSYFVANNFAIGITGSLLYGRDEANYSPLGYVESVTAGVIPTFMYFFPVKGKLKPGISAGVGYLWVYEDGFDLKGPTFNIAPGISYFINRTVSFDLGLQYSHNRFKNNYPGQADLNQNSFGLLAGVSVYF